MFLTDEQLMDHHGMTAEQRQFSTERFLQVNATDWCVVKVGRCDNGELFNRFGTELATYRNNARVAPIAIPTVSGAGFTDVQYRAQLMAAPAAERAHLLFLQPCDHSVETKVLSWLGSNRDVGTSRSSVEWETWLRKPTATRGKLNLGFTETILLHSDIVRALKSCWTPDLRQHEFEALFWDKFGMGSGFHSFQARVGYEALRTVTIRREVGDPDPAVVNFRVVNPMYLPSASKQSVPGIKRAMENCELYTV
jgi:hypothetical protein